MIPLMDMTLKGFIKEVNNDLSKKFEAKETVTIPELKRVAGRAMGRLGIGTLANYWYEHGAYSTIWFTNVIVKAKRKKSDFEYGKSYTYTELYLETSEKTKYKDTPDNIFDFTINELILYCREQERKENEHTETVKKENVDTFNALLESHGISFGEFNILLESWNKIPSREQRNMCCILPLEKENTDGK